MSALTPQYIVFSRPDFVIPDEVRLEIEKIVGKENVFYKTNPYLAPDTVIITDDRFLRPVSLHEMTKTILPYEHTGANPESPPTDGVPR